VYSPGSQRMRRKGEDDAPRFLVWTTISKRRTTVGPLLHLSQSLATPTHDPSLAPAPSSPPPSSPASHRPCALPKRPVPKPSWRLLPCPGNILVYTPTQVRVWVTLPWVGSCLQNTVTEGIPPCIAKAAVGSRVLLSSACRSSWACWAPAPRRGGARHGRSARLVWV
jgi:hypothetical protein